MRWTRSCETGVDRSEFDLEGGYNHDALAASVKASLDILIGDRRIDDPLGLAPEVIKPAGFDDFIKMVKKQHRLG